MKTIFTIIILLTSLNGTCGDGFPPPVQISPDNIDTNTAVQVDVRFSLCKIPSEEFYSAIEGNNIQLVFASTSFSPCPPGFFVQYYNLGTLPEGQYTVTVYDTLGTEPPLDPNDPNVTLIQYGDPVTFGVGVVRSVPTLNILSMISMIVVFMLLSFFAINKRTN